MKEHAFYSRMRDKLGIREAQNLLRTQRIFERKDGHSLCEQTESWIDFSSNDYLGLAKDPELINAWQQGLTIYGAGSQASPLVTGYLTAHQALAEELADWLGFDHALLFNSGFAANQAVIHALLEKGDRLIQDKLNHASLMEAGILSPATMQRFPHNDTARLTQLLDSHHDVPTVVVTEGVFSMDGDLSPLVDIHQICLQNKALLMVDDAHGIGVLGEEGRGSCANAQVKPDILVVTFGKAVGMMGAAVLCNRTVHDYLINFSKHYVYSTAMPPAQAYALLTALHMVKTQAWRREKLTEFSAFFHEMLGDYPQIINTETPIKPVIIGDPAETMQIAKTLKANGFFTGAIRPPTVPPKTARLRITLSASHSKGQVDALVTQLRKELSA